MDLLKQERQQWGSGYITFAYKALFNQSQEATSSFLALALCDITLKKGVNIYKGEVVDHAT